MRYLIDAKVRIKDFSESTWDVFISSYNDSARVREVFKKVNSGEKRWWVVPEYNYSDEDLRGLAECTLFSDFSEANLIIEGLAPVLPSLLQGARPCFDITGMMRNQILFLMKYLKSKGVTAYDLLYTEPSHYARKADTTFSRKVDSVRQVEGYEGQHQPDVSNDVLLLGVGYDDQLMGQAILHKDNAHLVQLHSLPSLSADMYHESLLRLDQVSAASSRPNDDSVYFADANDPFVTAEVLAQAWREMNARRNITNIYLCPLATKVQAVGFGLFYLNEMEGRPASVVLPSVRSYSKETSSGVGRTWLYPIKIS